MNPKDFLDVSWKLIDFKRGRPRQVDLLRAVSTAYYALYHYQYEVSWSIIDAEMAINDFMQADRRIGVHSRSTSCSTRDDSRRPTSATPGILDPSGCGSAMMGTMRTDNVVVRCALVVSVVLALLAIGLPAAAEQSLTVVSFGGSYARASQQAYHEPFTEATGIEVRLEDYNGGLAQIRAQVETGNVYWDVVDLNVADAVLGCDEGLLEFITVEDLPPAADGTPAEEDFVTGTLTDCGMGTIFFSSIYAYHPQHFPDAQPSTVEDFFDLERFPGRRGMRRVPGDNLELALLADGVPLEDVYATLDTPEGVDRAFRKLDAIKDQIVWWEAGAQPPQMRPTARW